jgi:hypothetical protein
MTNELAGQNQQRPDATRRGCTASLRGMSGLPARHTKGEPSMKRTLIIAVPVALAIAGCGQSGTRAKSAAKNAAVPDSHVLAAKKSVPKRQPRSRSKPKPTAKPKPSSSAPVPTQTAAATTTTSYTPPPATTPQSAPATHTHHSKPASAKSNPTPTTAKQPPRRGHKKGHKDPLGGVGY